jgi:alkylation response protein AidB-like acyl-CoA dehydrogenase
VSESPAEFAARGEAWLAQRLPRRPVGTVPAKWGEGSDSVSLFHNLSADDERAVVDRQRAYCRDKSAEGFHAIMWAPEYGGLGLGRDYEAAFAAVESNFVTPSTHEAVSITRDLIGPTIRAHGTEEQRARFVASLLRTDEMWCQLMSEPGAGSDVASMTTRAERHDDTWVVNGQKVWTSGAQFADFGYLLARTDPSAPKHRGITAFIVDMRSPGVTVRPLRQMSGGSSFNEVFFDDVLIPDSMRLDEPGRGWTVALTTLGFERSSSGGSRGGTVGGHMIRLMQLARHTGANNDPVVRQALAKAWTNQRLLNLNSQRLKAKLRAGQTPGPEGSIGKLAWTMGLTEMAEVAARILGPALTADTGEWGTFVWVDFVTGARGYRVAGGTDEIQRNIIGERALGLPREP